MLGLIGVVIAAIKKRTWFAVYAAVHTVFVFMCAVIILMDSGEVIISQWILGWLPFVISLLLRKKTPEQQTVIVKAVIESPTAPETEIPSVDPGKTYQSGVKNCQSCGATVDSSAKYCEYCGTKLS